MAIRTTPPLLELKEATVMRGGRPVLDRITLTIEAGEHTAIIGPNGSGKSTLIQLLTRRLYPLARRSGPAPILIFGRELWHVDELRSRMGIVSPDLHQRSVVSDRTGLDTVLAGFFASEVLFLHHRVESAMIGRAEAALERIGAAGLAGRRIAEMSTGEVRRVLIARALVHEPELLVLDEPTTGLDLVARRDFLEQIRKLARSATTLVLITHHLEEIIPEIGRVLLLGQGHILADGAPEAVLTSEQLTRAFRGELRVRRVGERFEMSLAE